jgi:hypothetical protein
MKSRNLVLSFLFGGALFFGGFALAQGPVVNIDEAQKENKDELGGHAQKAKDLIDAADRELKVAAEFADHRK